MQESRPSLNMNGATGPMVIQQILDLHEDRPDVMRKVRAAFDFLYTRKPGPETPKALLLKSLLTILEYCGDFTIQTGILQLIICKDDVKDYKEWFAKLWFEGMPNTITEFIKLVSGTGEQTQINRVDLSNFLMVFNMERPLKFVASVQINYVRWNEVPMRQTHKAPVLFHLNSGTRTLSITGIESRLPPELVTRGAVFIKTGEVQAGQVYTLSCPLGTEIFIISIHSSVGRLTFQLDPLLSNEEWHSLQEFFHYIFQVRLDVVDKEVTPPKNLNANDSNAHLEKTRESIESMEPENQGCSNQPGSSEPAKSMVSSSSQVNISINCLEPMVLPNQEDIQMCDQFARQSAVSKSSNVTIQLDPENASAPSNKNLANQNNEIVGSSCDGQKKKKAIKRRASTCNNGSLKQKPINSDSENEACLSSIQIGTSRRETRSLSRTRTQPVACDEQFKAPKQCKRGGTRGRGRGAMNSRILTPISMSPRAEDGGLNEATTSDFSSQQALTSEVQSEQVPIDPSFPTSEVQSEQVPIDPFPGNSDANSLMVHISPPGNQVMKVSSMPTLDTPYATPQHEFSSQVEPKLISLCDNGDSQSILKSHENLLTQFEACEALSAGPPAPTPIYTTSNYFDAPSSNQPSVSVLNCSPRLEAEHKKLGSDIESDTSLLESAVESAVLLPVQYEIATVVSTAHDAEKEDNSSDREMDPLRLE